MAYDTTLVSVVRHNDPMFVYTEAEVLVVPDKLCCLMSVFELGEILLLLADRANVTGQSRRHRGSLCTGNEDPQRHTHCGPHLNWLFKNSLPGFSSSPDFRPLLRIIVWQPRTFSQALRRKSAGSQNVPPSSG